MKFPCMSSAYLCSHFAHLQLKLCLTVERLADAADGAKDVIDLRKVIVVGLGEKGKGEPASGTACVVTFVRHIFKLAVSMVC